MKNETPENTQAPTVATSDISFEVGFKGEKTRLNLRMISVSEEMEFSQKLNDISDSDEQKSEKEFEICLDALVDCYDGDGKFLREKFSAFNVKNERIVRAAFNQFRASLQPEISFLPLSVQ
jgi:hypothetical protein